MNNKSLRIYCGVLGLASLLTVITIMFEFYTINYLDSGYQYVSSVWGFQLFTDTENWSYLFVGILGFVGLLWDLVFCAYAVIKGEYGEKLWQLIRYGYFWGIVTGLISFGLVLSLVTVAAFTAATAGIIFLVMTSLIVIAKGVVVFFGYKPVEMQLQEGNSQS